MGFTFVLDDNLTRNTPTNIFPLFQSYTMSPNVEHQFSVTGEADARHEIEETVHTVLYPGTEVMTDGMSRSSHMIRGKIHRLTVLS